MALMKPELSEVEREKYVSYPNHECALVALSRAPSTFGTSLLCPMSLYFKKQEEARCVLP